ncbi:3040_t:CDS:2, partial [Scutellospora calospora]
NVQKSPQKFNFLTYFENDQKNIQLKTENDSDQIHQIVNNELNELLCELLKVFFDSTNRGNVFSQISKVIIKIIEDNNQTTKNIFAYLKKYQDLNPDLRCLLNNGHKDALNQLNNFSQGQKIINFLR